MRVQDIIDKITDETKVDDLLIDLSELAEEENKHETKISELENNIKEKLPLKKKWKFFSALENKGFIAKCSP